MEQTKKAAAPRRLKQGYEYLVDFSQRSVLLADILRKRGNTYLEHLISGQPPVLVFDCEPVMDGKNFERPVNYALVRIQDRRCKRPAEKMLDKEKRMRRPEHDRETGPDPYKRPIVVIDPRAGHGPGIAGLKLDSQIGTALNAGHPVYFIKFFTDPFPGQTVGDVQRAQVKFIEKVAHLHPKAEKPAIIGNCQAGWAAALIGADRPDVTGPLILNGSPLSYWGGVRGASPMRYRGGLFGGSWLASFGSDIGNGKFDGAYLVAGFEALNPANTYWTKLYNVFSRVDTEERRFLDFEKWWGGFFMLSREEIRFIVNNLFIADELEQGFLKLQEGSHINLKNFKDPIVIFASAGDDITPPQQALNWIPSVYKTVDEIKRCEQVIVYLLHEHIGHLGIFVSTQITKKEHKEIISSMDALEYLSPGLYEMIIKEGPESGGRDDYLVAFEEREIQDILDLGGEHNDVEAFHSVSAVSKFNDKMYRDFVSPWVRAFSSEVTADYFRQLQPLRIQRYAISDMNPFMWPVKPLAGLARSYRRPLETDNFFSKAESVVSGCVQSWLTYYQRTRDDIQERLFYMTYGNEWMKTLFFDPEREARSRRVEPQPERSEFFRELEEKLWQSAMKKGGFGEAIIRIVIAVSRANQVFDMRQYRAAEACMRSDERLKKIRPEQVKQMVKEQSAILEKDEETALQMLVELLPDDDDRLKAFEVAYNVMRSDLEFDDQEVALLDKVRVILFPPENA